jgi:LCP family protein required for cell wall assembly
MTSRRLSSLVLTWLLIVSMVACGRNGSAVQEATERTIYVGPQLVDCAGTGQRQCLQLREGVSGGWFYLNGGIEGFQYEEGYEYELQILEEPAEKSADGGATVGLTLIQVVNKIPVDLAASDVVELVTTGSASLGQEIWTAQGLQPGFQLRDEVHGWCALGSVILSEEDAWRCYTQRGDVEETLDPCIPNPYNSLGPLACVRGDRSVTLLTISDTLPIQFANSQVKGHDWPAVFVLENGDECDLVAGEAPSVAGKRVSYRCRSGSMLIGEPNRSAGIWTIEYSADASGTNVVRVPIVRALAFQGDTAWTGGGPIGNPTGVLANVLAEPRQGFQRIIFEFSSGGLPAYDLLYTSEPAKEVGSGKEIPIQGNAKLRTWFSPASLAPSSQKVKLPAYAGSLRIPVAEQSNVNEIVFGGEKDGEMDWYIGMNSPAGFRLTEESDPPRLIIDVFEPTAGAAECPMLVLGSKGQAVRALQERLVAQGYLAMRPAQPDYDEDTWQAVAIFEEKHGLNPDGIAGPEVWETLARPLPQVQTSAASATPAPEALGLPRSQAKSVPAALPEVVLPPDTINIVLLGTDQLKPGKIWRTDSIIILSVNTKEKTAGMLSIPRDLWVYIPTIGYNRINTADVFGAYSKYPGGSAALVKETIRHNLGIPVHYYVRGSLLALISLVDTLEGIDVAVDCSLYDGSFMPPVNFRPGIQHMDGRTALRYARSRFTTNDFDRSRRQQRVLRAIWDKALRVNVLPKVPDIWNSLASYIQTDLSTGDILSLAYVGVQMRPENIRNRVIGYGQVRDMIGYGGAMVLVARPTKLQEAVAAFFDPLAPPEPTSARVILKNGTAKEQYTELAADRLHWEGMSAVPVAADRQDYPATQLIIYGDKPDVEARLVSAFRVAPENVQHLPEAEKPADGDVVLVLGSDYSPCQR